jgi:hypothetical protein
MAVSLYYSAEAFRHVVWASLHSQRIHQAGTPNNISPSSMLRLSEYLLANVAGYASALCNYRARNGRANKVRETPNSAYNA